MTEVLPSRAPSPGVIEDAYPMSELQVGMVYEMERDRDRLPYHNVHTLRVSGAFDEQSFRDAVAWSVARHPILRTSFALVGFSEPMQLVFEAAEVPITVVDLRGREDADVVVSAHVAAEWRTPLDVTVAPLCRMAIHVLADNAYHWTFTEHHSILDGWSLASLVAEITEAYRLFGLGQQPVAAPLPSTYRDFIVAEREALASEESTTFWRERLAELPDHRLPRWPADRPSQVVAQPVAGERHTRDESQGYGSLISPLPAALAPQVRELARQCRVPVKAVLLAAHVKVMSLVTGSSDVVVGLTANGRLEDEGGADVCGLFVNTLPLRVELPSGSWRDLIRAVFDTENDLLPHRRYPMGVLQRELGGSPLFETNFVYTDFQQIAEAGDSDDQQPAEVGRTHFAMVVAFVREPGADRLNLEIEYDARSFPAAQLAVLRDYYARVLAQMVADVEASHTWAPLLGDDELALLDAWNTNVAEVPDTPVHRMVEAQAAATPDAIAVVAGDLSLTYAELNARANRVARTLRSRGIEVGTAVGVCAERSLEMVVAWLGVLKAGGTYVQLDPAFPAVRKQFMLEQSGAPLVLTTTATTEDVPEGPWRTLVLGVALWVERDASNLDGGAGPDDACYVIFTSGSTGLPKGVVTRHRNVTELLHGGDTMTLHAEDTLLAIATPSFDVSTFEVWAPLVSGARLVLAPPVRFEPQDIAAWVSTWDVTVLHATASLFALLVDHEPQLFDGLRRLLTGSETVSPGHVSRILDRCPDLEVVNCWGPTETTTFSVCGSFRRGDVPAGPLPLGVPLVNTDVWVLDDAGAPVPVGSPGELYVSGPCLARGYLGRPDLTAERFLPHRGTRSGRPGERLYRTGDRGRWAVDGQVEFLGRVDHMVKVRGYRVELGEVESALRDHPAVRDCVVVTRANSAASVDLVAYLVVDETSPSSGEIRTWLGERLPSYMVPRLVVFMDVLPLTSRAKVDRSALPEPEEARPDVEQEFVAPLGDTEQLLAGIWCEVLGVDRVGRHDDFFDLGGDSIRSIQVLGLAREAGVAADLATMLANPTVAELAAALTEVDESAATAPFSLISDEDRALLPDGLDDAYPMAELQVGMVYEMERDPERSPYHNVHTLRLSGTFDEACFREALARVTARHPVLRTSFAMSRFSEPLQLVHAHAEIPLTVTSQNNVDEYLRAERHTPFDLTTAPLCRMAVHVLSADSFQWTVTEHHAIFDGWSLTATLSEISDLYEELLAGRDPRPAPLRSLFRDFVAAERAALNDPASRTYWHELLSDSDGSPLPRWSVTTADGTLCDPRPGERHTRDESYGSLVTPLSASLRSGVEDFARKAGVPFKTAVLAAHLRALAAVTGRGDVTTGLSSHGRLEEADGAEARGLFLNTLPLRVSLPDGSWVDLARAVLDAEHEVLPHRRYPMAALQRELGRTALFEAGFLYNDFHRFGKLADGAGSWQLDASDHEAPGSSSTNFPLLVSVSREAGDDGLRMELEYDARELTAEQVTLLRDYHVRVLEAFAGNEIANHATFALVSGKEALRLAEWSSPASAVSGEATVHGLVAAAAAQRPDAVAVTCDGVSLTYRELLARADKLALRLRSQGVGPEVCVGVFVERSCDTVVACLAVMRAGGVYVPLDPAFPLERMGFMLRDVAAPLVVVHAETADRLPEGPWALVDLDDEATVDGVLPEVGPDHGAYVIFTSGSTGRPKGTMVTHRNVVRLIRGVRQCLPFGIDDVWSLFHSFAFDFSVWEMWGALTTGGRLVVVTYAVTRDTDAFHRLVVDEGVTILSQTPSAFRQFETADDRGARDSQNGLALRAVVFGGEALHRPSVRRWAARHGYAEPLLVNMYGITETTVHVTYLELDAELVEGDVSPIGRPLPDLGVQVLDRNGMPCPVGVTGELHVTGAGLARGYVGRPALTAERFVPAPDGRRYRSGDLARWNALGALEYFGRADTQVKIRGYRIETGEIETVLASHPNLLEAAVLPHTDADGRTDLIGYLVPDGEAPATDELRDWLGARLPSYMIPRQFIVLAALALTAQGKVDRRALPKPQAYRPELDQRFVAPEGVIEEVLAAIWCQVLGVDRVGRHDNFFDVGGDSIRSIQILGRARDAGLSLGLQDILDAPTLAELAARVSTESVTAVASLPFSLVSEDERALLPDGLEDAYPMAELQVGMVVEMERDLARNAYHNVETVRLAGTFDEACFRAAVDMVVARHPVLRTSFDLAGFSEPMQLVHERVEVPFTVADLRSLSTEDRLVALSAFVETEQRTRFDLAAAPLCRMAVHVVSDNAFQWTITEHHAILDGWSMVSTIAEITGLYRALLAGERPEPEPLRSLYRDFVAAERAALKSPESQAFWREQLASAPAGRLPEWTGALAGDTVEGERHDRDESAGHGVLTTPLSAELLGELEDFAGRAGVAVKAVVLAAHLKVIGLLTGSSDVLIGMTANGRLEEADGAEARGLFLNTVPLRLRLPEGTWQDLAIAVHRAERDLLPHRRYPMAALQREHGGEEPLFHTNFTYNNFHRIARLAEDGTLDQENAEAATPGVARTNFALDVTFSHEPIAGGMQLEIGYALSALTADQVTRLRDSHLRALAALVRDGAANHRASALLGAAEEQLLASWQGAEVPVSDFPVHELFRERVALWPDAIAVEAGQDRITFAELDARSDALACGLVEAGAALGDVVGLHLRPGVDAIVAVWATWKAGCAFLPLDPELPSARLATMLEDAAPTVIVSREALGSFPVVAPDASGAEVPLPQVGPRDLAYVMFTSGSTGRPKGVMIEHASLTHLAEGQLSQRLHAAGIEAGQHRRILTGTSAFISDFFITQLLPLLDGHCLTVLADADVRDPRHLVARAQDPDLAIDVIDATTSQVMLMVDAGLLDAPHPPRLLAVGGEACPADLWDALRAHPEVVGQNTYGPAEATVEAVYSDVATHPSPVIGRSFGNVRVYVVDDCLGLVPPGTAGEIVIGGPGVGRGYVGRPAATAEVFVPDPWGEPGNRLYRTGDLGRYTADGQLEFLGRNDHQVKILGQRVEMEDVEAALRSHSLVEAAAVSAHRIGGRVQLVGHLVMTGALDRDELRSFLSELLPAAAVPAILTTVDALPRTAGGKLDRAALAMPDDATVIDRDVVAPRTGTEQRIAAAWQSVLGVPEVGVHDDFFALGGHSLLAVRLAMRVSSELGADLPLHEVFARPTVAEQAELIDRCEGTTDRISPVDRGAAMPASHAQERQFFLWQLAPESPTYHVPWGYEIDGDLDLAAFGAAVDTLIERHETLRTTLHLDADGQVVQRVEAAWHCVPTVLDVAAADVPALVQEAVRQPFDLGAAPILRLHIWRTAADRHVILFVAHHIAIDEWSAELFERELWAVYEGDEPAPLEIGYADYSAWHRGLVARQTEDDLAYWRDALDGATSSWPRDGRTETGPAQSCSRLIPAADLTGLDRVRARSGATDFMLYLAVYSLLLARRCGERDLTIGVPVSGRSHPDLAPLVGFFVNTLALRVTVNLAEDFPTHLERVRTVVLEAFAHQEAPFEHVVRAVAPDRATGTNPLFHTMFTFTAGAYASDRLAGRGPAGLALRDLAIGGDSSRFDLALGTTRATDGLHLTLELDTALFDAREAEELVTSFGELLHAVSAEPQVAIADLLRANDREQRRIAGWSDAAAVAVETPVHELFRERLALWPDAVAVETDDEQLTYTELDELSDVLARSLVVAGAKPGDVIGLHLRPGIDAIVAVWAAWKAGGGFLPLDPELPEARLQAMLEDAAPSVVVSHDTEIAACPVVVPGLDVGLDVVLPKVGPQHLAYAMFTSGSTGRAKAVLVDHRGLASYALCQLLPRMHDAGIAAGTSARVLTGTSAFISDFFLLQLLPLLDGHRLFVLTGTAQRDPRLLVERAQDSDRAVDVIGVTMSQGQLMVDAGLLDAPHPPRLVVLGGEAVPHDLWEEFRAHPRTAAHNIYGPAEATVDATYATMADHESPVIGRSYGAARVYLVDEAMNLVAPGACGEILIGGPGVGQGYVARPAATAAAFVPDPWGEPGSRLYRSGDLARYTFDGQLEFLGRNDHQVKILGQRVEPEDVEAALRGHFAVEAAAVSAHKIGDRRQLVAHLVMTETLDRNELRAFLTQLLPAAAVPTVFVRVDRLPMTVGGKLDRAALTVPDDVAVSTDDVVAPRTETERRIAEAWQAVLGVERVGVHEDFFALGGHSLLAIRLTMRLDANLALHEVFAHPTVAAQAALLDERAGATGGISGLAQGSTVPASHAQERQWFLWQLDPASTTYTVPWGYDVRGPLDLAALEAVVATLVDRHEPLRTTLHMAADGKLVQRIEDGGVALATHDVTETELAGLVEQLAGRPFDLGAGPVLRADVLRVAPDHHVVLFVAHHIAIDEWSLEVFERELWTRYRGGELAPLDVRYADYSVWHRDLVADQEADDLAFWQRTLDDVASVSAWPHPIEGATATPAACDGFVAAQQLAGLDAVRAEVGATDFMALLAAHSLLLARSSGDRELTIGVPVSGRAHADLAPLVGFFVNTLALRVTVHPEDDFRTHLERIQAVVLEAFAHQETPFEHVVRAVAPDRGEGVNPLFRTMFSFTAGGHSDEHGEQRNAVDGLTVRDLPLGGGGNHFDLSVGMTRTARGLHVTCEYSTGHLAHGAALVDAFADLVTAVTPTTVVADLLRASPREQERIAAWTGGDAVAEPTVPVHETLRTRTASWPDAIAVESADERLTFADLDARSDTLARALVAAGAGRGDLVGLHLRPGVDAVVAVWAAWKAGAAFLPLDPDLPRARLDVMLADAAPAVVVSYEDIAGPVVAPDADGPAVPLPRVSPQDLAYVMFTSGSTGRPKGVMVDHASLANYAENMLLPRLRAAGLGVNARILTGTSAFLSDFFIAQLVPLLDGHRLLVLSGEERRDPRLLVDRAQDADRAIQVVDATTSQVQLMVAAGLLDAPHPPKLIIVGGEACPPDLWDALRANPEVVAHNTYGPAEATVDVAFADLARHATPVIGRSYGNARIHLLDAGLNPVAPGAVGEIVIGGPGVSRGYLNRPAATAAAFVPDPWGEPGSRLYRTGDLARYTVDGQLEFLGRNDHQVKILGQRIEPEDVEAALRSHSAVEAAAVSAHKISDRLQLVAHLVTTGTLDREAMRSYLSDRLPAAAIPTVLTTVDRLPLTDGGKLDRAALTVPEDAVAQADRDAVLPRTETEQRIAAAWQSVLGLPQVGVHDDFFALGGHSLLAVRLTLELSREFGTEIPLAQLYTAPTIAEQAARLGTEEPQGHVVPLGGTPGARPLVFVHPLGGTLFSYLDLLAEAGDGFEAFGLQGRIGQADTGATDLTALARRYADELVPILGDREPVIAGWSAGGVLAHELARTLTERGIAVHRLVLIDSDPRHDIDGDDVTGFEQDIATLDKLRHEVAEHGPEPLLRFDGADRLFATLGVDPAAIAGLDGATVAALMAFWRDMFTGLAAHRPSVFAGAADLVLADGDDTTAIAAAWRDLTGSLAVTHAGGDHFELLRRPWVTAVADTLSASTATTGD